MRFNYTKGRLVSFLILLALPVLAGAQTTKPKLKKPAPRTVPLVPVDPNLKVRLNDTRR